MRAETLRRDWKPDIYRKDSDLECVAGLGAIYVHWSDERVIPPLTVLHAFKGSVLLGGNFVFWHSQVFKISRIPGCGPHTDLVAGIDGQNWLQSRVVKAAMHGGRRRLQFVYFPGCLSACWYAQTEHARDDDNRVPSHG